MNKLQSLERMVSKEERKKEGKEEERKVEGGREEREKEGLLDLEMKYSVFGMDSWPCYHTGAFLVLSN